MNLNLTYLTLEVTRRCNMGCAHCLRGEAENLDMTKEIVDKALEDVEFISSLTLSGGEPTLNTELIRYILDVCMEKEIVIEELFVATNGKEVPLDFLHAMIDWDAYVMDISGDDTYVTLALSEDMYHEDIEPHNKSLLRTLSCFEEGAKRINFDNAYLINEGRAKNLKNAKKRELSVGPWDGEIDKNTIRVFNGQVYISANGEVKRTCNAAYDNHSYTIGDLNKETLSDIVLNQLVKELKEQSA